MLIHNDEKGHVIIGEAALSLALSKKEISVTSLIAELSNMAKAGSDNFRFMQISEAKSWLESFDTPEHAVQQVPYLQTLTSLNEEQK